MNPIGESLEDLEDAELVDQARQGESAAYEVLVSRHRDKIYARAFSMVRSEEQALDLSQEAWIKAWRKLHQFHGDSSFVTWLTRVTINICLDHLRKRKRERSESIEELDENQGGVERKLPLFEINPTERLERQELRTAIDKGLAQLSADHRTVLVLHQFEGLEYKEVAERMNCSIGTVMSRLFYARKKLAALLIDLKCERENR